MKQKPRIKTTHGMKTMKQNTVCTSMWKDLWCSIDDQQYTKSEREIHDKISWFRAAIWRWME
jgi:hypothetical protein